MKSRNFFLLILSFSISFSYSQSIQNDVIATSGDSFKSDQSLLSWTLGECVVETYSSNGIQLNQGFHQPYFYFSEIQETDSLDFKVTIYPNPTSGRIKICIWDEKADHAYDYSIFDVSGRILIDRKEITGRESDLDLTTLQGEVIYMVIYRTNNSFSRTFKVIKVN
jgi:hypothetical protein